MILSGELHTKCAKIYAYLSTAFVDEIAGDKGHDLFQQH